MTLEELEALEKAAIPGPYYYVKGYGFFASQDGERTPTVDYALAAMTAVPELIATIRRLENKADESIHVLQEKLDKAIGVERERCAVIAVEWLKIFTEKITAVEGKHIAAAIRSGK